MTEDLPIRDNEIYGRYRLLIVCAAIGVLLVYALGGYFGARVLRRYARDSARARQNRIVAAVNDTSSGRPPASPSPYLGARANPVDVKVALRVNRIGDVALKDSAWTADFNIAFRWTGDSVAPGKTFHVVDGHIDQRDKAGEYEKGEERYEEYRVVARIAKSFDASRFPFGDDELVVEIEDSTHALNYVTNTNESTVGPEALPRSLRLARTLVSVTARPETPARGAHSEFFLSMLVASDGVPIFLSLFQALFAAVAVALIALFIKPRQADPRFGLPVGGFFAAVGNNVFVATHLPASDRLTLTSMVNTASLLTIFLVLVQSAVSLYILDTLGQERLSRLLDRTFFFVLLIGYVAVILALPLAASIS